jgi:hypothetical protein
MAASPIAVIRTLQADYGLGEDTILAVMADYVAARCDPEDFENYMLDRAVPDDDDDDPEGFDDEEAPDEEAPDEDDAAVEFADVPDAFDDIPEDVDGGSRPWSCVVCGKTGGLSLFAVNDRVDLADLRCPSCRSEQVSPAGGND